MTNFEFVSIIVLHILSGLLPMIGVGHAVYRKGKPVRDRATYIRLRRVRDSELEVATEAGDPERAERAEATYLKRVNRPNKNKETLDRFAVTTIEDHFLYEKDDYENLRMDAVFVIFGVVVGVGVNVWSTVIGLRG